MPGICATPETKVGRACQSLLAFTLIALGALKVGSGYSTAFTLPMWAYYAVAAVELGLGVFVLYGPAIVSGAASAALGFAIIGVVAFGLLPPGDCGCGGRLIHFSEPLRLIFGAWIVLLGSAMVTNALLCSGSRTREALRSQ